LGLAPEWSTGIGGLFTLEARHTGHVFTDDAGTAQAKAHTLLVLAARFEQINGAWTWRQFVRIDNLTD